MTSHPEADDAVSSTDAVTSNARRRRLATAAGLAAAVVGIAGAAAAWHWHTHPDALSDVGTTTMKLRPGETAYAGVTFPDPDDSASITITSASAKVVENSADARTRFFVCALDTDRPDSSAIGVVDATTFSHLCPNPEPVVPGIELDLGTGRPAQLVAAITVNHRGNMRAEGVDVSYEHGWQNGTQTVAANLFIRAK
ncbi:MAG TPA: hypothetical protein VMF51_22450 [Nocardioides sp.]|uniref:hypothetical protein n=1 Tax=Nocardioides sp. TaxID=35761 RepID=UPI002C078805|nr:hypothetical protein [Nocardioides sp.]HTW17905.1 hypothetical protein [Nocardioides sp.]